MQICIDQGNTATKVAVFDFRKMLHSCSYQDHEISSGIGDLCDIYKPEYGILSSVRSHAEDLLNLLNSRCRAIRLSQSAELPFTNTYKTKETLGGDRIANAAAAAGRYPDKPVLVVDCGSCLTFTMVDRGTFLGGSIAPGVDMRFKALQHFTGKLPLVSHSEVFPDLIGDSSIASILSGVQRGIIAETDGLIAQYCSRFSDLIVLVTGGNTPFFENHLKSPIFAAPYLTLEGLNEILLLNTP